MIKGNDPILLTPGPLTTSLETKQAMLRDWGSWDESFNAIRRPSADVVEIVNGKGTHVCVPLQGSGTFAVEAALANLVPRDGKVLVPNNGAYCTRIAKILKYLGREHSVIDLGEDRQSTAAIVEGAIKMDPRITHVARVRCGPAGDPEPTGWIAGCVRAQGLIVDAMSSFGAVDMSTRQRAVALEQVHQGAPGMGSSSRKEVLRRGLLDPRTTSTTVDVQQKTARWRYATCVVAAFVRRSTSSGGGTTARRATGRTARR
jgi:2-aminoethylphosphonate-pyruvate transaminase